MSTRKWDADSVGSKPKAPVRISQLWAEDLVAIIVSLLQV